MCVLQFFCFVGLVESASPFTPVCYILSVGIASNDNEDDVQNASTEDDGSDSSDGSEVTKRTTRSSWAAEIGGKTRDSRKEKQSRLLTLETPPSSSRTRRECFPNC